MPSLSVRVHPETEQIHIDRPPSRIGLRVDMAELDDLITQLVEIRDSWPLRRQIEREQAERLAAGSTR